MGDVKQENTSGRGKQHLTKTPSKPLDTKKDFVGMIRFSIQGETLLKYKALTSNHQPFFHQKIQPVYFLANTATGRIVS